MEFTERMLPARWGTRKPSMPKPTIFSISVSGHARQLFSIQEKSSGDLTLIVKHSPFSGAEEAGPPAEGDAVIEERFSIHISPESSRVNVIKYTQVLKDGRRRITRNYTEAIKIHDRLAGIYMRRNGDMSESRYIVKAKKGKIVSLGSYDPKFLNLYI